MLCKQPPLKKRLRPPLHTLKVPVRRTESVNPTSKSKHTALCTSLTMTESVNPTFNNKHAALYLTAYLPTHPAYIHPIENMRTSLTMKSE